MPDSGSHRENHVKKATVLAVFFLVAGAVFGQEFTFRGLPWGSMRGDIIGRIGEPDFFSDSLLNLNRISPESLYYTIVYKNQYVAGYIATIGFRFSTNTNRLIGGNVSIDNINQDYYEKVFDDLVNKLTIQYGNRITNLDPLLIAGGWQNIWVSNKTMISMNIYEAYISISYFPPGEGPNHFGDL